MRKPPGHVSRSRPKLRARISAAEGINLLIKFYYFPDYELQCVDLISTLLSTLATG